MTPAGDICDLLCLDVPNAERIRALLPAEARLEASAGVARSLGDPTRLRVAAALAAGDELCVCDLAWIVGAGQGLVSHHLRQLKAAGVAQSRRAGRMVMYRLSDTGRVVLDAVLGPAVEPGAGRV